MHAGKRTPSIWEQYFRCWWNCVLHGITRKAFHRPAQERLWCGKTYLGRRLPLGFQCPISPCPTMDKVQSCLHQAQTKVSVQSFCLILKLSPLKHTWSAVGPRWLLDPRGCYIDNTWTNGMSRVYYWAREKGLVNWDYIICSI